MSDGKLSLADLVAQEREAMVPSEQTRAGNLEGLRAAMAEGRTPLVDVPPPVASPSATGGGASTGLVVGTIVVGALAVALALWLGRGDDEGVRGAPAVAVDGTEPTPNASESVEEAPPTVERGASPAADTSPVEPEPEPEPVESATPVEASAGSTSGAGESSSKTRRGGSTARRNRRGEDDTGGGSDFAEELRALKKAKAAADAGRNESALRTLDRAAKRFGAGFFDEERRALRVRVLCALGRRDAGRAAAASFFREYPASPQTERVRHACD